jgi:chaperonin GroES
MNIQPLSDRVVLKALEKENITSSGIYIPDWANKERPFIYEVLAVWPGKEWKNIDVKVWDKVLCGQYAWDDVKVDGKEFKIVAFDYILAKMN